MLFFGYTERRRRDDVVNGHEPLWMRSSLLLSDFVKPLSTGKVTKPL